jgi:enamine deaminase RidA (YjgF/YER057c/UK114 family)
MGTRFALRVSSSFDKKMDRAPDDQVEVFVMKRVLINPAETQPLYDGFHFSQANRVGDPIWVSGQVGIDDQLTAAGGMAAQARLAFEYFPHNYPAWTAVGVTQLALPELRVEIRAVAVAGSSKD